jgi:hypothetical protein
MMSALDRLDARRVAEDTIVHTWNDGASTSGDKRAFIPTWAGASCNGTANVVDRDKWIDTGGSGKGGPAVMAAIDMGAVDPQRSPQDDVNGSLWWDAVEHLRDELGYDLPETAQQKDTGPSLKELAAEHLDQFDSADEVPNGFLDDLTPDGPRGRRRNRHRVQQRHYLGARGGQPRGAGRTPRLQRGVGPAGTASRGRGRGNRAPDRHSSDGRDLQ